MTFQRVHPRPDLGTLEGYHSPQLNVSVRLNTNESPFAPPASWQEQLADEVASMDFHRYPDREAMELRTAIGELHRVGPEQVFAANGSNEVLQTLCLAYGGFGRTAVTFEPTYAMHSQISRTTGTNVVIGERDADFGLSVDIVASVLGSCHADITFLCSPNNPTGDVVSEDVLRYVIANAPGLIIVDEAYGQFAPRSALSWVHEDSNVVVIRTFSKTWAMAGHRLGYCVGPSWLIDQLQLVALPYHLDIVKQAAGRLALRYESEMRVRVEQLVAERNRVMALLRTLPIAVFESKANFILFRPEADANVVWQQLVDRGVLVRNCGSWPRLRGCLRMTVGSVEENDSFLVALSAVLENMRDGTPPNVLE
jgi:histidinol-phosphate aminotransferase